jgi:hypothetical protein
MPAPEGSGPRAAVFGSKDCHVGLSMLLRRAELHSAIGGVNLFRGRWFAPHHIKIPVAACIVAAAAHRCAFENVAPAQRRRMK